MSSISIISIDSHIISKNIKIFPWFLKDEIPWWNGIHYRILPLYILKGKWKKNIKRGCHSVLPIHWFSSSMLYITFTHYACPKSFTASCAFPICFITWTVFHTVSADVFTVHSIIAILTFYMLDRHSGIKQMPRLHFMFSSGTSNIHYRQTWYGPYFQQW